MSDADMKAGASGEDEAPETVLQSAVWLVQDLGFAMPPVPDLHAQALREISLGRLFATDRALVALDSRAALADALRTGWPGSGLAFGYRARGRGGTWFYTLVGGRQILHLSLALSYDPVAPRHAAIAAVDAAHHRLDHYLGMEANYVRAVLARPHSDADSRRVIAFTAADGDAPVEAHADWTHGPEPLGRFVARAEVFSDTPSVPEPGPEMIFRV